MWIWIVMVIIPAALLAGSTWAMGRQPAAGTVGSMRLLVLGGFFYAWALFAVSQAAVSYSIAGRYDPALADEEGYAHEAVTALPEAAVMGELRWHSLLPFNHEACFSGDAQVCDLVSGTILPHDYAAANGGPAWRVLSQTVFSVTVAVGMAMAARIFAHIIRRRRIGEGAAQPAG